MDHNNYLLIMLMHPPITLESYVKRYFKKVNKFIRKSFLVKITHKVRFEINWFIIDIGNYTIIIRWGMRMHAKVKLNGDI